MIKITKLVLAGTLCLLVFAACVSAVSVEEPLAQAQARLNKIMAQSRLPTQASTSRSAFSTMAINYPIAPPPVIDYNYTCPSYVCVPSQGDCYSSDDSYVYLCPEGEYYNETSYSCNCRRQDQYFKYGDVCDPDYEYNQCGPKAKCLSKDYGQTYYCVAERRIGDYCNTDYDCDGWRVCIDGKCAANLPPDAQCWNSTFFSTGICPLYQYCPEPPETGPSEDYYNCTSYPKLDQPCDYNYGCVPPWICGASGSYEEPTCGRVDLAYIPAGQPASNYTYELSCTSLLANYSSGHCVSYEEEKAKWESYYPANTSCVTDADCNLYGVNIATCHCTQYPENNYAYCVLDVDPYTYKPLYDLYLNTSGPLALGYKAGCESPLPYGETADFNPNYCYSNYSTQFLYAYCYVTNVYDQHDLDYDTYSCYEEKYCISSSSSSAVYYPSSTAAPPVYDSSSAPPVYESSSAAPPVVYSSSAAPPVVYSSSAPPVYESSSAAPPVVYSSSAPPPVVVYSSSAASPYDPYSVEKSKGKFKTQDDDDDDFNPFDSGANSITAITSASVLFTCAAIVALITS
jgi:hypothetical protein